MTRGAHLYAWASDWILRPDYLPAWLQAFAAIVAIFISVWAALRATTYERRRDRLQVRGIAVVVYLEVLKLEEIVRTAKSQLSALTAQFAHLAGQSIAVNVLETAHVALPVMIDRNVDRLFMLGDVAGPACLQLVSVLLQYNALVDQIAARVATLAPQRWTEAIGHLDRNLTLLEGVIAKCKHEVRPLHDAING